MTGHIRRSANKKEARFRGPLCLSSNPFFRQIRRSSTVAVTPGGVPARSARRKSERLQFEISDAGRDVQPGLALHAERLQCVGILRPADKKVAAATDPDRCIGADATVITREVAASNPAGRRVHRP